MVRTYLNAKPQPGTTLHYRLKLTDALGNDCGAFLMGDTIEIGESHGAMIADCSIVVASSMSPRWSGAGKTRQCSPNRSKAFAVADADHRKTRKSSNDA